jgi:lipocalin
MISPAQGAGNDLPAVANLDIAKYSGLWYSVAEIQIPADQGYDLKCTRDRKVVYTPHGKNSLDLAESCTFQLHYKFSKRDRI